MGNKHSKLLCTTKDNERPSSPPPSYTDHQPTALEKASSPNGFCPGAIKLRQELTKKDRDRDLSLSKCSYCGLEFSKKYPSSYIKDWPNFQEYNAAFEMECHIPATPRDGTSRLSCILCWEHEKVWVEPMSHHEWGLHMRKHFKDDGYWTCKNDKGAMMRRGGCSAEQCAGVHY